jgi:hypothetical protein
LTCSGIGHIKSGSTTYDDKIEILFLQINE